MRRIFFVFTAAITITACNNESKTDTGIEPQVKAAESLPYMPAYSSSFKMGNSEYSSMILQGSWKDWENNTMDNMKSWVADTIVAFHSDNSVVRGLDSLNSSLETWSCKIRFGN